MGIVQAPREQLPPLDLRRLRDLDLSEPPSDGRPAHIASASGIAKRGSFVYVVGDDLLEVGVFELAGGGPGRRAASLPPSPTRAESLTNRTSRA